MAQTHDLGPFFFHTIDLKEDSPRFHRAQTHEVDEPFRISNSLVLRIFGTYGIVLGRWRETDLDEESALIQAMDSREMAVEPADLEDWRGPEPTP